MTPRTLRDYGPRQFPDRLGLAMWEFERARADGLIPPPGPTGRWPSAVVDDVHTQLDEIRAKVGDLPDLGATRAAAELAFRLTVDVDPDTIVELARLGHITEAGYYKEWPLYCGRSIAAFRNLEVLTAAAKTGRQRDRAAAAAYLEIRLSDLEHLIRSQWLKPIRWVHSGWQRRRDSPAVPLFRTGDLDGLLGHPAIDWAAVRATPPGRPSPLAQLQQPRKRQRGRA